MILKSADDKSKRIALLKDLQQSTRLSAVQRNWLDKELVALQRGIEGEREAAFHIDSSFREGDNYGVLHDLRFEVDGQGCQIDHLLIGRAGYVFLVESKNYGADVTINEHGEFSVRYGRGAAYGVPSPIEQNKRHELVLRRLFTKLGISPRVGDFKFVHAVVFHPKAVIHRPDPKRFDASNVIKMDTFATWQGQWVERSFGVMDVLGVAVNIRSAETVREWGDKLKRQHRPADLTALPTFMQLGRVDASPEPMNQVETKSIPEESQSFNPTISSPLGIAPEQKKRLVCDQCGAKLDFAVGQFCWRNSKRFGGGQYCREHQALFPLSR